MVWHFNGCSPRKSRKTIKLIWKRCARNFQISVSRRLWINTKMAKIIRGYNKKKGFVYLFSESNPSTFLTHIRLKCHDKNIKWNAVVSCALKPVRICKLYCFPRICHTYALPYDLICWLRLYRLQFEFHFEIKMGMMESVRYTRYTQVEQRERTNSVGPEGLERCYKKWYQLANVYVHVCTHGVYTRAAMQCNANWCRHSTSRQRQYWVLRLCVNNRWTKQQQKKQNSQQQQQILSKDCWL